MQISFMLTLAPQIVTITLKIVLPNVLIFFHSATVITLFIPKEFFFFFSMSSIPISVCVCALRNVTELESGLVQPSFALNLQAGVGVGVACCMLN